MPRRPLAIIGVGALMLLMAAGWVVFQAARPEPGPGRLTGDQLLTIDQPFPANGRFPGDPYIGSKVCAECHPGEVALHARSGHAMTLRPAGRLKLARRLDGTTCADPEWPDVRWSYQYVNGRLHLTRQAPEGVNQWIVDYAFGSGRHATTFVNVLDLSAPRILEHRLTHYTRNDVLDLTPGQNAASQTPSVTRLGNEGSTRDSRKCVGCHSTQVAAEDNSGIDPQTLIPNVTCERCHGPGRTHVEAARRFAAEDLLRMPFGLDGWNAESLMMMCGRCHRHPSRAEPDEIRPDDPSLARFQPVGIIQSRCYRESAGAFSCLTCHDPHARASSDRASYNAVCLSCHSGSGSTPQPTATPIQPGGPAPTIGRPCTASPRGNCVECHMPRVDSGQHVLFTDHWIRIRSQASRHSR
jgi:hypothetical protein